MPKIIDNAKEKILIAAKAEVKESGFSDLGIREISKRSGIAVGTIYHYFPSKVYLIASLVLENWESYRNLALQKVEESTSMEEAFLGIYESIHSFCEESLPIFSSYKNEFYSKYYFKEHPLFIEQLSEMIEKACQKHHFVLLDLEKTLLSEVFSSSIRIENLNASDFISVLSKWLQNKGE